MPHNSAKRISLLLAGLLLLGGCAAPGAEMPTPTPTPEVTPTLAPTPMPTPEPEPTPAPPTVAMERPDLTGEWHRTDCHSESSAWVTISEQTAEGFLVEAECYYGAHSGTLEPTAARFIGETTGVMETYGNYEYRTETGPKPPVQFSWDGDTMTITTLARDIDLGFGGNVYIQGTYTRGEPEYINAGQLDRLLSMEEQRRLQKVVGDYDWSVAQVLENGSINMDVSCLLADGRKGRYLSAWYSPNWGYTLEVVLAEDGKTYFQGNVGFYTDDAKATELPEVVWPLQDDTHDCFTIPTGGKLGTVLVTVELVEIAEKNFEEQHFSVWHPNDFESPIQTMTAEDVTCFKWKDIRDANFDGYMDFGYMYTMGNQPAYYHYWIWDEEQGLFVAEPEFDRISWPQFDEETGVISGWARSSCCSGIETYHCWEDGKLVCVRQIELHYPEHNEDGTFNQLATVEDRINGELTEVFREYCTNEKQSDTYPFEEVWKWKDLNYHGE